MIAPLDWGLGHATRCVPVIEKLLNTGFKVIIAAEGDQKILLQSEFPDLEMVDLPGYRIKFGASKWRTILKIILQVPKLLIAINMENKWLRKYCKSKHLDIVISDNRFGLYHRNIISVFITHQLLIKTSLSTMVDAMVQRINYHFIKKFNYCWVPDAPGAISLAGQLSHPLAKPSTQLLYIGVLSRIKKISIPLSSQLLVLLSGPAPQRSIVEKIILAQLINLNYRIVLVRGLPGAADALMVPENISVFNHLSAAQLQQAINEAAIIICRSGYSTLMDVLPLGKKCILIPTPGQAEQEYLAEWLAQQGHAVTASQDTFVLPHLIEQARGLQVADLSVLKEGGLLDDAIALLITRLNVRQ
ncbi:MAG: glycosyltransferase [Chitinophagaceae bacterium]